MTEKVSFRYLLSISIFLMLMVSGCQHTFIFESESEEIHEEAFDLRTWREEHQIDPELLMPGIYAGIDAEDVDREELAGVEGEWVTYRNEDFGFEFEYPSQIAYLDEEGNKMIKDFAPQESPLKEPREATDIMFMLDTPISIAVQKKGEDFRSLEEYYHEIQEQLEEYFPRRKTMDKRKTQHIIFNGYTAFVAYKTEGKYLPKTLYIEGDDYIYRSTRGLKNGDLLSRERINELPFKDQILFINKRNQYNRYQAILNSFRFIQ